MLRINALVMSNTFFTQPWFPASRKIPSMGLSGLLKLKAVIL
ncbi:hypothetical protein [Taibaiella helva]|nr:hypothetical protein [Taibaiella helva]